MLFLVQYADLYSLSSRYFLIFICFDQFIAAYAQDALADPNVLGIVLEGSGKCFSAGADIEEFSKADDPTGKYQAVNFCIFCRKILNVRASKNQTVSSA